MCSLIWTLPRYPHTWKSPGRCCYILPHSMNTMREVYGHWVPLKGSQGQRFVVCDSIWQSAKNAQETSRTGSKSSRYGLWVHYEVFCKTDMSAERAIRWWKAWSLYFVVEISGRECSLLAGCVGDKSVSNRCNRDAWQLGNRCWHVEIEIDRKSLPLLRIASKNRKMSRVFGRSLWDRLKSSTISIRVTWSRI